VRIVRVLSILVPVLAFAAGDSTEAKRGWLGVYTDELSKPMLVALDIDEGVLVTDVAKESPAEKAGIEVGDVITSLDGQSTSDGSALRWAVRDRPEKKVAIKVHRRGKDKVLDVILGTREGSGQVFDFEWPAVSQEALQGAKRVLRDVGPQLKLELEHSDLTLDSLRKQMVELRNELRDLRKKLTEKQKNE